MTDRRGPRFVLEVLFLVVLAAALTFAKLDALEIAGMMLLGWLIVAAVEWAAWRGEPHYGSGLPPRYYVPSVNLPPAQPLEQVAQVGYPDASRDEAPTWIAPAALRAEMLGEWPVSAQVDTEQDPWEVFALPGPAELEDEPELEEVSDTIHEVEPEPPLEEVSDTVEPSIDVVLQRSAHGLARYSLDPLAEAAPKRRFGRAGGAEPVPAVEVPARPEGARALPGRSNGQD